MMDINKANSQPNLPITSQKYAENVPDKREDALLNRAKKASEVANETSLQTSRKLMNQAIVSAQQDVNIKAGNESMVLLYSAAIEAINKELEPTMGENAIQTAYEEVDTTPEATADRIVSFATQFFSLYQQQNASMAFDEQLDSFLGIIGDAIDTGFTEAKDILSGLNVLEGDIAKGVEQTYELVQLGLESFKDSMTQDPSKTMDPE